MELSTYGRGNMNLFKKYVGTGVYQIKLIYNDTMWYGDFA